MGDYGKMVNDTQQFRETVSKTRDLQEQERKRQIENKKKGNEFFATLEANKSEPILDRNSFNTAYSSKWFSNT